MGQTDHLMLDLSHECRMCTFGTGSSAVSGESENSTNTLKNCAKTAAKINVRQASEFDEFQHVGSGYLEFYTNRARPPYGCCGASCSHLGGDGCLRATIWRTTCPVASTIIYITTCTCT
jgi:hypothetical protein